MLFQAVTVFVLLLVTRMSVVLSRLPSKLQKRTDGETCALAVFLGSGFSDSLLFLHPTHQPM